MARFLVVDDEYATVEMIGAFLSLKGHEWIGAYGGNEALTLVELEAPDMIILDLMMPDMDGFEVCRRVRSMNGISDVPILIVSARTDQEAIDQAMSLGASGYMTKPLKNFNDLIVEIEQYLD